LANYALVTAASLEALEGYRRQTFWSGFALSLGAVFKGWLIDHPTSAVKALWLVLGRFSAPAFGFAVGVPVPVSPAAEAAIPGSIGRPIGRAPQRLGSTSAGRTREPDVFVLLWPEGNDHWAAELRPSTSTVRTSDPELTAKITRRVSRGPGPNRSTGASLWI
jgi:hypothetical protein